MKPTVSINLCCYNSERYLRETLNSIVNQTYKDWELIIINDGSSDSTESIVREYIDRGYPIVYHHQENRGLGYSRNEALKRSQGEYIAFIDHDDLWLPEKLEKQMPLFQKNKKVAIVITNAILFNDRGDKSLCYRNSKPKTGYVFKEILRSNFICLPSAVIRKSSLNSLNEWFDTRFNHIEEAELFARIAYNWQLDYVDEALAKNRIHKGSSTYLRPELSPMETEIMVKKFEDTYPDFRKRFKPEIQQLEYYIQYGYALSDWKLGNNTRVRQRLKPFLALNHRAKIQFMYSFFPYSFYETSLLLYRRYIKSIPVG